MADKMPDVLFFIVSEILSDKSKVYNVLLGEHKFEAATKDDAEALAGAFIEAIEQYTNSTADVIDETA